eukprot:UN03259
MWTRFSLSYLIVKIIIIFDISISLHPFFIHIFLILYNLLSTLLRFIYLGFNLYEAYTFKDRPFLKK